MPSYYNADDGRAPWLTDDVSITDVKLLDNEELSLEEVAALKPDLILGGQYYEIDSLYEELSRIAPTLTYQGKSSRLSQGSVRWMPQTVSRRFGSAMTP